METAGQVVVGLGLAGLALVLISAVCVLAWWMESMSDGEQQ
jgi:hypothetical protein